MRDWRQLYKKYRGQWVAIADDQMTVIANGESRHDVKEQAAKGSSLNRVGSGGLEPVG